MEIKQKLIEYISANANEEELLELCEQIEDRKRLEVKNTTRLKAFISRVGFSLKQSAAPQPAQSVQQTTPAATPEPATGPKRLNKAVVEKICAMLSKEPCSLSSIALSLGISTGRASGIMHVLADRGVVSTDGRMWSLVQH